MIQYIQVETWLPLVIHTWGMGKESQASTKSQTKVGMLRSSKLKPNATVSLEQTRFHHCILRGQSRGGPLLPSWTTSQSSTLFFEIQNTFVLLFFFFFSPSKFTPALTSGLARTKILRAKDSRGKSALLWNTIWVKVRRISNPLTLPSGKV